MARHLAIETAYARNIADPLVLTIDDVDYHLDPAIDVGRLAALFTRFQDGLTALGDEATPIDERVATMTAKRSEGINALAHCISDDQRQAFVESAEQRLDLTSLANVITWLLSEVSGQPTPTPPPSSSNGSSAAGPVSTDGAPPEESTPSP